MSGPQTHRHDEMHRGVVPEDQLGATAPSAGDVLTASGTGEPDWATPVTHDAVTLASDADVLLGLTGQQLTLDAQSANVVLAGPTSGGSADPTFRALVDADIPSAIARDSEVTSAVSAHTGDTTDAHAASAIAFTPAGTISATTVQAAIEEVATEAGSIADIVDLPTAETDTALVLKPDGVGGVEWGVDSGSGPTPLAVPTVVGTPTNATGTGSLSLALPTGHAADDILLVFVQTSNQAASITTPGYTQLGPAVGFGTAAAAGSMRLTVFWKRDNGAETDPITVADSGDHTLAAAMCVRGCPTVGDPFLNMGAKRKTTASVTGTASGGSTPVDACLVVAAFAHALDSASAVYSGPTNADLASVTEQVDVATADGTGGGIGVITGEAATAKTFAATTVTETSTTDVSLTFVLLPDGITSRAGFIDRQVFLTPSLADTWTKPTGAMTVCKTGIGGGNGGGAGRNAATAAGGGAGGGGMWQQVVTAASELAATMTVTAGAGGAATANTDGAAGNAGTESTIVSNGKTVLFASGGSSVAAGATSGSGGAGGHGGGRGVAAAAATFAYSIQPPGGGAGATTGSAGGAGYDQSGGAGGGGGTTQAGTSGGVAARGGGGGGGGRSNTNFSTGGAGMLYGGNAGGATVGAAGADSPIPTFGGGGGASGNSASGPGGAGGWPGGGGGGGGSQSGAQRGGPGADGAVEVLTYC